MRLAIFGGSFDPPHVGHLLAAGDACDQLPVDRVIFIPTATQPLKAGRSGATAEQRLAMVRLLVANDARFEVSSVEVERGGLSFTVDTLSHFATLYPAAERFLLLGADVLETFGQWREPERIVQLARLVLMERQGIEGWGGESERSRQALAELKGSAADAVRLPTRRFDVSSTEIRERVRLGKPIRGFVTDDVAAYIARGALYR